jgi:hypothetical protein
MYNKSIIYYIRKCWKMGDGFVEVAASGLKGVLANIVKIIQFITYEMASAASSIAALEWRTPCCEVTGRRSQLVLLQTSLRASYTLVGHKSVLRPTQYASTGL